MESDEWNDKKFEKWLRLREDFRLVKKEKNYAKIIEVGNRILKLDAEAKFIGIFLPIFEKDMASAYLNLNQTKEAIIHYQAAIDGYKADQKQRPGSWLKDIERIEAKIQKLQSE